MRLYIHACNSVSCELPHYILLSELNTHAFLHSCNVIHMYNFCDICRDIIISCDVYIYMTERVKGQAIMSALPVWLPSDHH